MVRLGTASVVLFAHFVQGWQGTDPRPDMDMLVTGLAYLSSVRAGGSCQTALV